MKEKSCQQLEWGRVLTGEYRSTGKDWPSGAYLIQGPCGAKLKIIASGGKEDDESEGWEHVSVSTQHRPPKWEEMCFVKDLFWNDDEVVVQYHPAKSEYVNNHPNCLHLWRHISKPFPTPPPILVGHKDAGIIENRAQAEAARKKYGL